MELIGHRGASGLYPENTLLSFEKAFAMGCDAIELDVQQTADGQIVVFHDWTLDRCTDGTGLLRERSLAELQRLDVGKWFAREFTGLRMPTLEQVLTELPEDKWVNIEIKELSSEERSTEQKTLEIIRGLRNRVVISSFSHNLVRNIHKMDSEVKLGLLLGATLVDLEEYIQNFPAPIYSCHLKADFMPQNTRLRNARLFCWTVNEWYEFEKCRDLAVDGIITNYPQKLPVKVLKA